MSDIYIEVYWLSGMEAYSYTAIPFSNYQSLPRLMTMSDIIYSIRFDGEIENQTVTITLSNHDRYFDTKMAGDPFIIERVVKIKNSTMTLFTGLVREMPDFSDENVIVLKVDIFSLIDREINRAITKAQFSNCPSTNQGKFSNYVCGAADTYPSTFTAIRIDTEKFLAAWNHVSLISGVYDGETQITSFTVTYEPPLGYTYINCSSTSDEITFSCQAPFKHSLEHEWDPPPLDNPATMLHVLLETTDCQVTINETNYEEAKQRFIDRYHTGNVYITGSTTIKTFLSDFAKSYNCFIRFNRDLELELIFTEYSIHPDLKIHPTYIKNFQKKHDTSYLTGAFTRKYHYLPASGEFKQTPADVIPLNPYNSKTTELEQTYIIDDVTSYSLAHRERYIKEKPLLYVNFEVPKTFTDQILPGDYIYIKHRRHFFPNEYRKILVMRIVSNRKKALDTIEGFDFSHIEMNCFKICDASDPELNYIYETGNPANPVIGWAN